VASSKMARSQKSKPKVYIETSVVGYLTSSPTRDLVTAARQQLTRAWWDADRAKYELFVSEFVLREARAGDVDAARARLEALGDLTELDVDERVGDLAGQLRARVPLPKKADIDALHIAVAVVNGIGYLLTWNCRHIANAALRQRIESVCRSAGYEPPIICTPKNCWEESSMTPDPILAEIWKFREEYAKRFNHDLKAICRDIRKKQKQSGRKVVSLPPKRVKECAAARK
jgi:predicted nucleic acid-binding protein